MILVAEDLTTFPKVSGYKLPDVPKFKVSRGLFSAVDDVISSHFQNVYVGHHKNIFQVPNTAPTIVRKSKATTLKRVFNETVRKVARRLGVNINLTTLSYSRELEEVNLILDTKISIPSFRQDEDDIGIQTRRFESIKPTDKHFLREEYNDYENVAVIHAQKNRAISLMQQFIYEIRYHLPYVQLLRKKYINLKKYRIGYCFALLKGLKQQQMIVHSFLSSQGLALANLVIHLHLYRKIINLHLDIMDVIRLIKKFDKLLLEEKAEKRRKYKASKNATAKNKEDY